MYNENYKQKIQPIEILVLIQLNTPHHRPSYWSSKKFLSLGFD